MDKLKESKFLKSLGLDEKNEWMLYDENMKKFFEYMAENFDEDNILSEEELRQFEDLKAKGEVMKDEALTDALKDLEVNFPGILTLTDDDLERKKQELKILEEDNREREDRIARMEETRKSQQKSSKELEKKHFDVDYQLNLVKKECLEKADKLTNLEKSNQQKISQLKQIYTQPQTPPALIYQMPLDQHFNFCSQILGQLEVFMRKNFNVTNSIEEVQTELTSSSEIVELKKKILEVQKKKFEEDLSVAGVKNIVASISKFSSPDSNEIRSMISDLEGENENMKVELEVMQKEAMMMVEQSAERDVMKLFNEFLKEKSKRALKRLDTVQTVQEMLDNVTILCELLWVAMQLDLERLKNRVDNSVEVSTQAQDCSKRIRQMKIIAKRDPVATLAELYLKKLQDLIMEFMPLRREQLPNISACLEEYVRHNEETNAMMKSCVDQTNLKKFHDLISEIQLQTEQLRELIFCGPTNQPVLYDSKFTMQIYDKEQKKIELEKAFTSLRSEFNKNIVEPLGSDRFFKMEKNLWIYFLTEPKKVLECIKEAQKKAAEKGSASFKALNITVAK